MTGGRFAKRMGMRRRLTNTEAISGRSSALPVSFSMIDASDERFVGRFVVGLPGARPRRHEALFLGLRTKLYIGISCAIGEAKRIGGKTKPSVLVFHAESLSTSRCRQRPQCGLGNWRHVHLHRHFGKSDAPEQMLQYRHHIAIVHFLVSSKRWVRVCPNWQRPA